MADDIKITKEETAKGGRYVTVVSGHEAEMTFSREKEKAGLNDQPQPNSISSLDDVAFEFG